MFLFRPIQRVALLAARTFRFAVIALVMVTQSSIGRAQTLDTTFAPSFNEIVRVAAFRPSGGIIAGGDFSMVNSSNRSGLARIEENGLIHPAPLVGADGDVLAIHQDSNSNLIIGGRFGNVGGVARRAVAKVFANGFLDTSFVPQLDAGASVEVTHLAVQLDGKIIIAGRLSGIAGAPRDRIARLNSNGSLDTSYVPPSLGGAIDAMGLTYDGKVVIAGNFSQASSGCAAYCVIRLQTSGARDTCFAKSEVIGTLEDLSILGDGRILIAGSIGSIGTHETSFVGRLMPNGGADVSFAQLELRYSKIERIRQVAEGNILIAGEIRWGTAGVTQDRVARLLPNGARDVRFVEPVFNSQIMSIATSGNWILVAGQFTTASGIARNRIARYRMPAGDLIFRTGFD